MSFDKARIKRFNEESSCAPPPTKYDPKLPVGSSANGINFASYSSRSDQSRGAFAYPGTPGARSSRSLKCGTSSIRSSSDTRIRIRSRSTSTASLKSASGEEEITKCKFCVSRVNEREKESTGMQEHEIHSSSDDLQLKKQNLINVKSLNAELENRIAQQVEEIDCKNSKILDYEREMEKSTGQLTTLKDMYEKEHEGCLFVKTRIAELDNVVIANRELEAQFNGLKKQLEQESEKVQALTLYKEEVSNETEKLTRSLAEAEIRIEDLLEDIQTRNSKLQDYEREREQSNDQLTTVQDLFEKEHEWRLQLQARIAELDNVVIAHRELEAQFSELQKELEKESRMVQTLNLYKEEVSNETEKLTRSLAEVEIRNELLLEEIKTKNSKLQDYEREMEKSTGQLTTLKDMYEKEHEGCLFLKTRIAELDNVVIAHRELEAQFNELQKELEKESRMVQTLNLYKEEVSNETEKLTRSLAEVEIRNELLLEEIKTKNSKLQDYEREMEQSNGQLTTVQDLFEKEHEWRLQLQARIAELDNVVIAHRELEAQFSELKKELEQEYEKVQALNLYKEEVSNETEKLTRSLAEVEIRNELLLEEIKTKNSKLQDYESEMEQSNGQLTTVQDLFEKEHEWRLQLQARIAELDNVVIAHRELEAQFNELQKELEKESRMVQTLNLYKEEVSNETEKLTRSLAEVEIRNELLLEEIKTKNSKLQDYESEMEQSNGQLTTVQDLFEKEHEWRLQLQARIAELDNVVIAHRELEAQFNELQKELEQESEKVKALNLYKEEVSNENEKLTCGLGEAEIRIKDLLEDIQTRNSKLQDYEREMEQSNGQLTTVQDLFEKEHEWRLQLQARIAELENVVITHRELEAQFNELKKELEQESEKVKALNLYKEEVSNENEKLTCGLGEAEIRIKDLLEDIQTRNSKLQDYEREMEESTGQLTTVQDLFEKEHEWRLQLQARIAELENVVITHRELEAQFNGLKKELEQESEKVQALNLYKEEVSNENEKLTCGLGEAEIRIKDLLEDIQTRNSKLQDYEREMEKSNVQLTTVQDLFEKEHEWRLQLQARIAELDNVVITHRELEAQFNELQKELEKESRMVQTLNLYKEDVSNENEKLTCGLGEAEIRIEDLLEDIQIRNSKLQDYEREMEQSNVQLTTVQDLFEKEHEWRLQLQARIAELDNVVIAHRELEAQFNELQKELEKESMMIQTLNLYKEAVSNETEKLTCSLAEVEIRNELLLEEIKTKDLKLEDLETMQEDGKKNIEKLNFELEQSCIKISSMESSQTDYDQLRLKLQNLVIENESLQEQLVDYKNVYDNYAHLMSHQNNRQKIHHVIKIKDENMKLRSEVEGLRQRNAQLQEKLKIVPSSGSAGTTQRRFDPAQAFKKVLKEPYIRDDRDLRGPDARSTFTVSKRQHAQPQVTLIASSKKESAQGLAFNIKFENEEN